MCGTEDASAPDIPILPDLLGYLAKHLAAFGSSSAVPPAKAMLQAAAVVRFQQPVGGG